MAFLAFLGEFLGKSRAPRFSDRQKCEPTFHRLFPRFSVGLPFLCLVLVSGMSFWRLLRGQRARKR